MTAWKPGDVLVARMDEQPYSAADVRKFMDELIVWWPSRPRPDVGLHGGTAMFKWFAELMESAQIGPLVVIDPNDSRELRDLRDALVAEGIDLRSCPIALVEHAVRRLAPEPRPAEPGTWGVVEAACVHNPMRNQWIRHPDGNWWPALDYSEVPEKTPLPDDWDSLTNPVVIREGVIE